MLTKKMFRKELHALRHEYRIYNSWVQSWRKWDDETIMDGFIDAAYNLYAATARNALRLTILGDTEIRSLAPLVSNFGLMSAAGVQDKKDVTMVKDLEQRRRQVGMGTNEGLKGVPKVLGVGSILGDKMWTPILNDALMLGSIEGYQSFYLGLNSAEQKAWSDDGFDSDVTQKASKFGGALKSKRNVQRSNWLTFLRRQPQMIWRGGNPRVFARELLALKFFGYRPEYSRAHLAFAPGWGPSIGPPTFRRYTHALRDLGFFANDKSSVMGAISEFLFDDKKALL